MRKVFGSHSEVCHVWAQQAQSEGRAGNIFFSGESIYSYGYHYKMARIYTRRGKRFALLNSNPYSNSTIKHRHCVRDALRGLMDVYEAPNVDDLKTAITHAESLPEYHMQAQLKRIKVTSLSDVRDNTQRVRELYDNADCVRELLGRKPIKRDTEMLDAVGAHLRKRFDRYNSPEFREKREAKEREEQAKRDAAKAARAEQLKEAVQKFRAGGERMWVLNDLDFDLIRLSSDGGEVETSRGARVPLSHALKLFEVLKVRDIDSGARIGHYTFESIDRTLPDPVVTIGCHRILWSEAAKLFRTPLRLIS